MSYLLDTNSWVDHLRRGTSSKVSAQIAALAPGEVYLCSVVLAELLYGAMNSGPAYQAGHLSVVAKLRRDYGSLPFDDFAAEEYGKLRATLKAQGKLIGANDLMIASIALANQKILVTNNTSEFSRVPNLTIESWQ